MVASMADTLFVFAMNWQKAAVWYSGSQSSAAFADCNKDAPRLNRGMTPLTPKVYPQGVQHHTLELARKSQNLSGALRCSSNVYLTRLRKAREA